MFTRYKLLSSVVFMMMFFSPEVYAQGEGNMVEIRGSKGQWQLFVNDEPFLIKGAGVGRYRGVTDNVNYLKLAKEMGANTVRTWGINKETGTYLNKAHKYGLLVDVGIWINYVLEDKSFSYIHDNQYQKDKWDETIEFVKKYKDHPAVLFWNVGNEVFQFTEDEEEKVAAAKYIEKLIQEIKRIDPNHPVIYTSAFTVGVKYVKEYIPSIDIFGVNAYGGFDELNEAVVKEFDIPYLVTEFGTVGPWDLGKDVNGRPIEQSDSSKAHNLRIFSRQIASHYGDNLGGYAFYLGDTTQNSFTWWNVTFGKLKKFSYLVLKEFYTNEPIKNKPPIIRTMSLIPAKDVSPKEQIAVEVKLQDKTQGELKYKYFASTDVDHLPEEYPNVKIPIRVRGKGAKVTIKAPSQPGIYRIYVVARDSNNLVSTASKTISVKNLKKQENSFHKN